MPPQTLFPSDTKHVYFGHTRRSHTPCLCPNAQVSMCTPISHLATSARTSELNSASSQEVFRWSVYVFPAYLCCSILILSSFHGWGLLKNRPRNAQLRVGLSIGLEKGCTSICGAQHWSPRSVQRTNWMSHSGPNELTSSRNTRALDTWILS